jgi:exodeoxyribonuclease-5
VNFSPQQEVALAQARDWIRDTQHVDLRLHPRQQLFGLGGYAGTGKSMCANALVKSAPGRVLFMAPTGKAALVLRRKGNDRAATIHSTIYIPKGEALSERVQQARREVERLVERQQLTEVGGAERDAIRERLGVLQRFLSAARDECRPMFTLNEASELAEPDVWGCVVDEASMVDEKIAADLRSFGKPILALFDPFQLPPVRGVGGLSQQQDATLTEIHRQGGDSGILKLSMLIRTGAEIPVGTINDDCEVHLRGRVDKDALAQIMLAADQVIVGRNATRKKFNTRFRALLGRDASPYPVAGDRVVCRRNDAQAGVLNGSMWHVDSAETDEDAMRTSMVLTSADGTGETVGVEAHAHGFVGRDEEIPHYQIKDAQLFQYGYAITCHVSQGSEYDRVVVWDESDARPDWGRRHLYTAATRAAKNLVVIR